MYEMSKNDHCLTKLFELHMVIIGFVVFGWAADLLSAGRVRLRNWLVDCVGGRSGAVLYVTVPDQERVLKSDTIRTLLSVRLWHARFPSSENTGKRAGQWLIVLNYCDLTIDHINWLCNQAALIQYADEPAQIFFELHPQQRCKL